MPNHRFMVPMVLLNKGICLFQRYRAYIKHFSITSVLNASISRRLKWSNSIRLNHFRGGTKMIYTVCTSPSRSMVVIFSPHHSGRFARTMASAIGGHTAFPHRATCLDLG